MYFSLLALGIQFYYKDEVMKDTVIRGPDINFCTCTVHFCIQFLLFLAIKYETFYVTLKYFNLKFKITGN